MSAETLRRAAGLMRERAEAAALGPWEAVEGASGAWWVERPNTADIAIDLHGEYARHIASWHPAVALAVATWLNSHADIHALRTCDERLVVPCPALAAARAYLGESA